MALSGALGAICSAPEAPRLRQARAPSTTAWNLGPRYHTSGLLVDLAASLDHGAVFTSNRRCARTLVVRLHPWCIAVTLADQHLSENEVILVFIKENVR